eukprot:INCI3674.1.p1 GENE.INCI3674.1~~INCI3674.1.p1  ORF type:complete len:754 (-),score=113.51 INCI3674.1:1174-3435(-)
MTTRTCFLKAVLGWMETVLDYCPSQGHLQRVRESATKCLTTCRPCRHFSSNETLLDAVDHSDDPAFVLTCMREAPEFVEMQKRGSCALSRIVCANEEQQDKIASLGGIEVLLGALKRAPSNSMLVDAACGAIAAVVCDHSPNQALLVSSGGIQILLGILMSASGESQAVMAEASCRALVQGTYDNADAQGATAAANGFRVLLGTVSRHAKRPRVVEAACHVLGNMLMDSRVNQAAALSAAAAGPQSNTCCPTLMCNLIGVLGDHAANSRVVEIVISTLVILLSAEASRGTHGVASALMGAGGIETILRILRSSSDHQAKTARKSDDHTTPAGKDDDNCETDCSRKRTRTKLASKGAVDDDGCCENSFACADNDSFDAAAVVIAACAAMTYLAKDASTHKALVFGELVPILLSVVRLHSHVPDVLQAALEALEAFLQDSKHAPSARDQGALSVLRGVLEGPSNMDEMSVKRACRVLRCLKHYGGIDTLVAVLRRRDAPAGVVGTVCLALIEAGFNDKPACDAFAAAGGMTVLLDVMSGPHTSDRNVIGPACGALGLLVGNSENCQQAVLAAGGVPALLSSLQGHCARPWENPWLVTQSCDMLLTCMAKSDGIAKMLKVLREHKSDLWVVAVVCGALSRLVNSGGASGLLDVLLEHRKDIAVVNTCLDSLRSMAAAHEPSAAIIRHNTALVYDVRRQHPVDKTVQDAAKQLLDQLMLPGLEGAGGVREKERLAAETANGTGKAHSDATSKPSVVS